MKALLSSAILLLFAASFQACDQRKSDTSSTAPAAPATNAPGAADVGAPIAGSAVTFMNTAAIGGMMEVQASRLAQEQSNDPKIRDFAKMMTAHHSTANQELQAMAAKKSVALPQDLDAEYKLKLQNLQTATGAEFDRTYANQMVADHNQAVALFEHEAKAGEDPDVKAFAQRLLPKLREHLDKARELPGVNLS